MEPLLIRRNDDLSSMLERNMLMSMCWQTWRSHLNYVAAGTFIVDNFAAQK